MIVDKTFYIVRNNEYELVAIFTDEEDCKEFILDKYFEEELDFVEVKI